MSTRILDLFLGDLTDEEIETVLKLAVAHSEANVNRVLDLYFESSLPEVFELAKRLLEWREEAATPRLLESLADEIDYGRRQSTVWILGDSARMPGVLPVLESILDGSDVLLKEQVLARLRVNGVPEEGRSRMAQRLRDIVRSGGPSALRGAAAGALRGDDSKVGVRFLLDRVLDDPDFEVRQRALGSLPIVYSDDEGALEEEVLSGLYAVSMNLALPANLRRSTVRKLSWNLRSYKGDLFSQDQLAAIDVWVESFKK